MSPIQQSFNLICHMEKNYDLILNSYKQKKNVSADEIDRLKEQIINLKNDCDFFLNSEEKKDLDKKLNKLERIYEKINVIYCKNSHALILKNNSIEKNRKINEMLETKNIDFFSLSSTELLNLLDAAEVLGTDRVLKRFNEYLKLTLENRFPAKENLPLFLTLWRICSRYPKFAEKIIDCEISISKLVFNDTNIELEDTLEYLKKEGYNPGHLIFSAAHSLSHDDLLKKTLEAFPNIKDLDLSKNDQLTDAIRFSLEKLGQLQSLNVSSCTLFTNEFGITLAKLPLKTLHLENMNKSKISEEIFEHFTEDTPLAKNVQFLDLFNNIFTDKISLFINHFKELKSLNLGSCPRITDAFFYQLKLPKLTTLNLADCKGVKKSMSKILDNLRNLKKLNINNFNYIF